jgi:hypothetical protein
MNCAASYVIAYFNIVFNYVPVILRVLGRLRCIRADFDSQLGRTTPFAASVGPTQSVDPGAVGPTAGA